MPSLGYRNNNPGNLKRDTNSTPYKGEIVPPQTPPFRQFENMLFGYRAMFHLLIIRYIIDWKLNTIEKIIYKYAPPIENDTEAYINYVANRVGISRSKIIHAYDTNTIIALGAAMSRHENGIEPNQTEVITGFNMLVTDMQNDLELIYSEGKNPNDIKNALIFSAFVIAGLGIFFFGKKTALKQKQS
jgi:hypothetical protein